MIQVSDLHEKLDRILDAHRRGHWDKLHTVERLQNCFESLPLHLQLEVTKRLRDVFLTEPRGIRAVRGMGINMVGVALLALARFGPTGYLVEFVFSGICSESHEQTAIWLAEIWPDLRYCLYQYGDRFDETTLSQIEKEARERKPVDSPLPVALVPLDETLKELEFIVERLRLNRFEQSLRGTKSEQPVEASDLTACLAAVGLGSQIVTAMKDADDHLRGTGAFDSKKAADLLRACMDEAHRAIVKELARIKQESYSGKDRDSDRRAYMRLTGFISPPEEQFIGSIYSLISAEASHRLIAPRETVLVLQTTVHNFLILLLKRLANCKNSQQVSETVLVERRA
jgi:hypothetical protein